MTDWLTQLVYSGYQSHALSHDFFWATLKAGMMERQNDGMAESRNGGKSPQILEDGIAESRNGGNYLRILKDGIAESRYGGKYFPIPKRRNRGKSPKTPKRWNGGKSSKLLKDGIAENQPKS